jgi:plastocyanin
LVRALWKVAAALLGTALIAPAASVRGEVQAIAGGNHSHEGQQGDLSDLVIWLEPLKAVPVEPVEAAHARLLQKNKMFSPHVLAVQVGTVVDFPNADPIFHSAFSNYNGQLFDLSLYPPGTTKSIRFRRPGIVRVFCNIHPAMSAVIAVLDTPHFTTAKRDGSYQITNVPPGTYELHIFDERATGKLEQGIQIAIPDAQSDVHATIARVSEEGYVESPHKNKYGLDYPPVKDTGIYSGVPK